MITQSDTEWSGLNGFRNSEHIMQHFHYITPMITLNESSLFGLVCTSVTNNWIVYRIKGLLWLRKPHEPFNTPRCGWAAKTKKGIGSVPDPFCTGAYTASDKCPAPISGLATLD